MAKRPTLTDLTSLTNSSNINAINQNWDAIQTAFDNTLSLDGSTPNAMNSDIDLNGNSLLNVDTLDVDGLTLNGQTVTDLASVPEWRGAWVTSTSYAKNDLVKTNGNVYICLVAHTSGTFATDLTALKWELMVSKGDSGAGTGDLVSTNNLSDVANPATSRSNLGLGNVAVENTVPVAKGGTGATDAATARTNLSAQTLNANLTSLSGITLVQGDLLYATGPDTLVRLPKGTAGQVLQMNGGATAPEWTVKPSGFESAWHPYNMTTPGDGSTGKIYSFATNGLQSSVTATFEDGYDYLIRLVEVSGATSSPTFRIAGVSVTGGLASVATITGTIEILAPRLPNLPKWAMVNLQALAGSTGPVDFSTVVGTPYLGAFNFSAFASGLASVSLGYSSGNIDAGDIYLYRRRNYMFG